MTRRMALGRLLLLYEGKESSFGSESPVQGCAWTKTRRRAARPAHNLCLRSANNGRRPVSSLYLSLSSQRPRGQPGKHWTDAASMLGQRSRRWSCIQHTFDPFRVLPSGHNTLNQCCFKWTSIKNNIVCWVGRVNSQSRNFETMLGYCLASVEDGGQTITHHWVKLGHWKSDLLQNLLKIYLHRSRLNPCWLSSYICFRSAVLSDHFCQVNHVKICVFIHLFCIISLKDVIS